MGNAVLASLCVAMAALLVKYCVFFRFECWYLFFHSRPNRCWHVCLRGFPVDNREAVPSRPLRKNAQEIIGYLKLYRYPLGKDLRCHRFLPVITSSAFPPRSGVFPEEIRGRNIEIIDRAHYHFMSRSPVSPNSRWQNRSVEPHCCATRVGRGRPSCAMGTAILRGIRSSESPPVHRLQCNSYFAPPANS